MDPSRSREKVPKSLAATSAKAHDSRGNLDCITCARLLQIPRRLLAADYESELSFKCPPPSTPNKHLRVINRRRRQLQRLEHSSRTTISTGAARSHECMDVTISIGMLTQSLVCSHSRPHRDMHKAHPSCLIWSDEKACVELATLVGSITLGVSEATLGTRLRLSCAGRQCLRAG